MIVYCIIKTFNWVIYKLDEVYHLYSTISYALYLFEKWRITRILWMDYMLCIISFYRNRIRVHLEISHLFKHLINLMRTRIRIISNQTKHNQWKRQYIFAFITWNLLHYNCIISFTLFTIKNFNLQNVYLKC